VRQLDEELGSSLVDCKCAKDKQQEQAADAAATSMQGRREHCFSRLAFRFSASILPMRVHFDVRREAHL
jgi:hypothetical protein